MQPPKMIELVTDALDHLFTPRDRAADDVGVPVEILRRAVQAQIEPGIDRPEVHRRGEGVVDQRDQPVPAREAHDALQVRDLQHRVRHGLHIDRLRVRPELRFPRGRVVRIDEIELDAELREVARDQIVGAAIQRVLGDQMIARRAAR